MDNTCHGEVVTDEDKHMLAIYKKVKHAFRAGNYKGNTS